MTQTNSNQPTQLFNISKSYEGYPSRNNNSYQTELTWDDAVTYLDTTERTWRKNGGTIISRTESELIVEESDGSNTIIFAIVEQ